MTTNPASDAMSYLDAQAKMGVTTHIGGLDATRELGSMGHLSACQPMGYALLVGRK